MFKDDLSIHKFVLMALPSHVMDVLDLSMLLEEENDHEKHEEEDLFPDIESQVAQKKLEECLVSVMRIGVMRSAASPRDRVGMKFVVNNLQAIRSKIRLREE